MATFTTRLGLRKPDGTENVDVVADLGVNYDFLDDAAGSTLCTSTTRPFTPYDGQVIYETDTNHVLTWNGTAWKNSSIPVVTATSQITSPYEGMLIMNSTDDMIYVRRSSAWVAAVATGDTFHEARYYQNTAQTVANTADVKLYFDTAVTTCADVVASGTNNTDFTLQRSGLWLLSAGVRYPSATAGERHVFIGTSSDMAIGNRITGASAHIATTTTLSCTTTARLNSGTVVVAGTYQSSGASRALSISGQTIFISLVWLRP